MTIEAVLFLTSPQVEKLLLEGPDKGECSYKGNSEHFRECSDVISCKSPSIHHTSEWECYQPTPIAVVPSIARMREIIITLVTLEPI